jgi:hypothetical protein
VFLYRFYDQRAVKLIAEAVNTLSKNPFDLPEQTQRVAYLTVRKN